MSYLDLYLSKDPLIVSPGEAKNPVATVFGIPFDSTHSYKPGCRVGPDAIRKAFNNIEIFHPDLGIDLETASIEDLGNTMHTANVGDTNEVGIPHDTSPMLHKSGIPPCQFFVSRANTSPSVIPAALPTILR